jgi:hypothetical protein
VKAASLVLSCLVLASSADAQSAVTYQKPPGAIEQLLDAPLTPQVTAGVSAA